MVAMWSVLLCTERGSHLTQTWRGGRAETQARRAFDFIQPVAGSGVRRIELIRGGKHGSPVETKERSIRSDEIETRRF